MKSDARLFLRFWARRAAALQRAGLQKRCAAGSRLDPYSSFNSATSNVRTNSDAGHEQAYETNRPNARQFYRGLLRCLKYEPSYLPPCK